MSVVDHAGNPDRAAKRGGVASPERSATLWAPAPDSYFTDGTMLYRVVQILSDNLKGELFLELEDCGTLEVVLCPVRAMRRLGLRSVTPAA